MTGQCKTTPAWVAVAACLLLLGGCRFGPLPPLTAAGDHPIAYVKRPLAALRPAVEPAAYTPGGDLYLRDLAAPEAPEINVTGRLTRGHGDVTGPAVSPDGTRLVFALHCGSESDLACAADDTWNLWEYDIANDLLRRVIEDDYLANLGDDLDPAYLPDGRIVFTSNRQTGAGGDPWKVRGEDRPAFLLHVIDPATQRIEQITVNEADDRHPVVDAGGAIVYARRELAARRDQVALYRVRADGRDNRPWYGSHSPGEVYTRPEPLPDGTLLAVVTDRQGTGGALLRLDVARYGDENDRAPGAPEHGGQRPAGPFPLPLDSDPAPYGRVHSAGAAGDEVLVAYSPTEVLPGEDPDSTEPPPPRYGIYRLDLAQGTLRPLVLPEPGWAYLEPVPVVPRPLPPMRDGVAVDGDALSAGEGLLEVLSVYDSDALGRMGNDLLTAAERARMAIPEIAPPPGEDIRPRVADLARLKDPARTRAEQRPAWFARLVRALPDDPDLPPDLVGVSGFGRRQLIGYVPVEPDGSLIARVPADTPLAITVLDREARAFEDHDAWFQVRPGERLTCDGCHDPDRVPPLNRPPIAGHHPNTRLAAVPGETMAQTRLRLDPAVAEPRPDPRWEDVWTDPARAGRPPDPPLALTYAGLATPAPRDGLIDYPDHIQPLWDRPRPKDLGDGVRDYRCSGCHDGRRDPDRNPSGLDLRANLAGHSGRNVSYEALTSGDLVFNDEGRPYYDVIDGQAVPRRAVPLVVPGHARRSHLVEVLAGEELFDERPLPEAGPDHARLLDPAERRLLNEWIDLGAQYYNRVRDADGNPRRLGPRLSFNTFVRYLQSELMDQCATCHRPLLRDGSYNRLFTPSQFVLTGDPWLDFRHTAAQVDDLAVPENSRLVQYPSSLASGHPLVLGRPVLGPDAGPDGARLYGRLVSWIAQATEGAP